MHLRGTARRTRTWAFIAVLGLAVVTGCQTASDRSNPPGPIPMVEAQGIPVRVQLAGVENAYRVGPRLLSGGEPHGESAFRALRSAGVRTVISVDGTLPDIDTASKFGLRYVHVPIGYDGLTEEAAQQIAAAATLAEGSVFIHCHHGRHRGPAAAALLARAAGSWDADRATKWMKEAGTSPDYPGLYRSVNDFVPPDRPILEAARRQWKPAVQPQGIVEAMVRIDGHAEALADMKAAGWKSIPGAPDETPVSAVRQLGELYREANRLRLGPPDERFQKEMAEAGQGAERLEAALRRGDPAEADKAWKAVKDGCVHCHRQWRN